jgi:hypothetical protein
MSGFDEDLFISQFISFGTVEIVDHSPGVDFKGLVAQRVQQLRGVEAGTIGLHKAKTRAGPEEASAGSPIYAFGILAASPLRGQLGRIPQVAQESFLCAC